MKIPFYQVDAFASRPFQGNPAAVCPLDEWLADDVMQSIALENNLAETAFFVREPEGYRIRWFTPSIEMDLCGHATLASAFVLMTALAPQMTSVDFQSRSGCLRVARDGEVYALDFPARPPVRIEPTAEVVHALGTEPAELWKARDFMAVYDSEKLVRALRPDLTKLAAISEAFAMIVTAPGESVDFVSRFFAPGHGVPEDPVTGSSHCTLIPFWAVRLGKTSLQARQVSARGGELLCEHRGERVTIAGRAVLFAEGFIHL